MAIRIALRHQTKYDYDRLVDLAPQVVRLRPAPHCRTPILSYNLGVQPEDHFINWQQDPHGNYQARLVFPEKTRLFHLDVEVIAEMISINPFDFFLEEYANKFPFKYASTELAELTPYLETFKTGPKFDAFLRGIDRTARPTIDFLVELNQKINKAVDYIIRLEPGVQSPEETLTRGKGSCRDSAWLMVQLLRRLGFAARFASGYLIQLTADVKSLDGPSGPEADFTDLHAWCETYLPGAGWVGLDPTSGLFAGEGHIPLACTPNPQSASPVSGMVGKCEVDFHHHMAVTRIHEDPRVTKPYTEDQWSEIETLGDRVDDHLNRNGVRLTMGGEPTFVSIDDMDGEEWNGAALGPNKFRLAKTLYLRLRDRFASGALLHFGQGKWYPGESLPRWALSCYWRKDAEPVWNDQSLFATGDEDLGHTISDAQRFIRRLAQRLGVDYHYAVPAWEDPYHFIFHERKTPVNIDPRFSNLDEPEERRRLARILERGLENEVGYVLPLSRGPFGLSAEWQSGYWAVRTETLFLIPGDSPMGYRLPLDSLVWEREEDRQFTEAYDTSAPREPLPSYKRLTGARQPKMQTAALAASISRPGFKAASGFDLGDADPLHPAAQLPGVDAALSGLVRTALCVEPREGRLNVFMPPMRFLEQYLELVAAVEQTAAECDLPVRIEGYHPPSDPRLRVFKITPDPGVIEVNIHPSESWRQLVDVTTGLYEEARLSRLGTEKFMLDGRHTGTNGGNHFVLGGEVTADSPFLRRPDLLKSLLGFWNNHPSLSYLFSSTFIGPTSQAPRIDEARHEAVYELQLAFDQIQDGVECPPWLVDRVFRHLLTDLTGNTHRAEFCIDKLYSPDSASGRLGLVEFRNFEMPPHSRMSLTQQLLLRSLVSLFWEQPYREPLVRWGTQLHDRYMLPHFVWRDFCDVIHRLRENGYAFESEWFAPHFEFRFPRVGAVAYDDVEIELRQALEPWHVLGEEVHAGGTSRYVDSSLERLQVLVSGMTLPRHTVSCNGVELPLHPTGQAGQFCSGVRYRAWRPPSCLHPNIDVHSPLTFDLIDNWNQRSLGGCVYHVVHPGGRNHETFPINALEAEGRRHARFYVFGHTPGKVTPPARYDNQDYPFTLDLRATMRRSSDRLMHI
ncbi:MAG: IMP dehydrogenase [bacterium]|nr:IMP dehydrogenase [bacterium]